MYTWEEFKNCITHTGGTFGDECLGTAGGVEAGTYRPSDERDLGAQSEVSVCVVQEHTHDPIPELL